MPIINQITYFNFDKSLIEKVDDFKIKPLLKNYDFTNSLFYLVPFFDISKLLSSSIIETIPEDIFVEIKNGNINLLLWNRFEAFTHIVEPIYKLLVIDLQISEKQILLMTNALDILNDVEYISKKYNKKHIKVFYVLDNEIRMRNKCLQKRRPPQLIIKEEYNKKFINFNRKWRPHRPIFVALLIINDLVNHGYVSLIENNNFTWDNFYKGNFDDYKLLYKELIDNQTLIRSKTPLIIDKSDLDEYLSDDMKIHSYYEDTYFSIVSETHFKNTETKFITEKTLKPIMYLHPFLLIAPPFSLAALREHGYKTFHPFINEGYDTEINDEKRMLLIIEETKRLCSLDINQIKEFINNCKNICKFNYHFFMTNKRPYVELN